MALFGRRKSDADLRDEKAALEMMIREEQARLTERSKRASLENDVWSRREALGKVKSAGQPQSFGGFLVEGLGKVAKVGGEAVKRYGEAQERAQKRPQSDFNPGMPFGDPFAPRRRRKL